MKNKGILIGTMMVVFVLTIFAVDVVSPSKSLVKNLEKGKQMPSVKVDDLMLGNAYYTRMEIADFPQKVKSAVLTKYVAFSIDEVFCEYEDIYKLILKNGNNKLITFYTSEGEYLSQQMIEPRQVVAWN